MKLFRIIIAFLIILFSVSSSSLVFGQGFFPRIAYSVTVSFPEPQILNVKNQQDYILLEGGYSLRNDQGFKLPTKVVFINLPPGKRLRNFSVSSLQSEKYENVDLEKGQRPFSIESVPSSFKLFSSGNEFCKLSYIQKDKHHDVAVFIILHSR